MKVRGREGKLIQPGLQCGKKKDVAFFVVVNEELFF